MEAKWYAIQTTAGHENKVRSLVQRKIDSDSRPEEEKLIRQALVPIQDVVEIKNGKKVTVERKIFPGYVIVEMIMTQETLHAINSIHGVIKFVGSRKSPQPLHEEEINKILGIEVEKDDDEAQEEIPFHLGQVVEVTQGPFSDFSGTIKEIYPEKGKVKVEV
ncbi:MAG: transcription termination/antitermination factor NusG, partial [Gemmatimonadetes bacterium]|nr:transcription termination/antitermination factor NusG [Gemmatimonadota bacterium]